MSENKRINLASVKDMQVNCDEHIPSVLGRDFQQDFKLIDTKLILIYISIAISGVTFYLDKKFKNDFKNKFYYDTTVYLVVAFYVFTTLTYLYSTRITKDIKYVGTDSKQNKVTIATKILNNYDPHYIIDIELNGKKLEISKKFTELYNKDGFLQLDAFKTTLTDQISILKKSKF